jgi:hypothetical protein
VVGWICLGWAGVGGGGAGPRMPQRRVKGSEGMVEDVDVGF